MNRAPTTTDDTDKPATLSTRSLVDDILAETSYAPGQEGHELARAGVQAFLTELLKPQRSDEKVDATLVDALVAEIDQRISAQLDEILHHPEFQRMESTWRALKFVVDRVDFRENIKVDIVHVSKDDLRLDFEDAAEVPKSGLYRLVYSNEYGTFGGRPYGAVVANYDFGPDAQDIALLQSCAAVAAMAHAPFLAAAGPAFFGIDSFTELDRRGDLQAHFEGPHFTKWRAFRDTDDARNVGLAMPRFMLRLPYGHDTVPVRSFDYEESVIGHHERYVWGNAAFALATRIAHSFAEYRWCPNIVGPLAGGTVDGLPLHTYECLGEVQVKRPTETGLSERREYELSEEGFIPLTHRKGSDEACFFSANSCQRPKTFGQSDVGREAELNYRLGTQLPYLFITNRLAHYIKVLQREQLGSWKERTDLERELNLWIGQYVADMEVVSPAIRSRRPLRAAQISVTDVPGQAGFFRVDMKVRPHFKYQGAFFTLGLVGKLDKAG